MNRDEIAALAGSFDECDCGESSCLACHPIEPAERDAHIRDLLAANAAAIQHLDEGLRRGRLQVPPVSGPSDFDSHVAVTVQLRELCLLKLLDVRLALSNKDFAVAIRAIADLLQIGGMVCRGEGLDIQFMIGATFQSVAVDILCEEDSLVGATTTDLRLLRESLSLFTGPGDLAQCWRVEFTSYCATILDLLPQEASLEALVDGLIEYCFSGNRPLLLEPGEDWKDDGRLAKRREQILELLAGHKRPYVPAETVRLLSGRVAQSIAELRGDPKGGEYPSLSIDSHTWWPLPLSPRIVYEILGDSPEAIQERLQSECFSREIFPKKGWLTQRQMRAARRKLAGVYNPVGLLVIESLWAVTAESSLKRLNERATHARGLLDQLIAQADK